MRHRPGFGKVRVISNKQQVLAKGALSTRQP